MSKKCGKIETAATEEPLTAKCPDNEISAAQRSKVGGKTPHNTLRNSQGKTPIVSPQILYATAVHIKIVQKTRKTCAFGPVSESDGQEPRRQNLANRKKPDCEENSTLRRSKKSGEDSKNEPPKSFRESGTHPHQTGTRSRGRKIGTRVQHLGRKLVLGQRLRSQKRRKRQGSATSATPKTREKATEIAEAGV